MLQKSGRIKSAVILLALMSISTVISGQNARRARIYGKVSSSSGEALPGVNVVLKNTNAGTVTNAKGQFEIRNIAPGNYLLLASFIGYKTEEKSIQLKPSQDVEINIKLDDKTFEMSAVEVSGKSVTRKIEEQAFAVTAISAKKLYNSTSDAQKILDRVPGVRIMEEGGLGSSSNFTLNGFSGNQIKFFMDGIPMDNFGSSLSLSNIPVNMIDHIEVYKGVVPVWLGTDALGGAVNIITNKSRNFLDASYTYGSFNTHRASVNTAYTNKETGFTARANAIFNYSDNNYKIRVPVTNSLNQIVDTAEVERFHDRYRSGTIKFETGFIDKKYADNLLIGIMASANDKQVQNGATMAVPYGGILKNNKSLIPTLKYNKTDLFVKGMDVSLYGAYTATETQNIDTLSGVTYNWRGEAFSSGSTDGENSRTFTTLNEDEVTAQLNTGYRIDPHSSLALNYAFSYFHRKAFDKENPDNVPNQFPKSLTKQVVGLAYKFGFNNKWTTTLFGKFYWMKAKTSKQYDFAQETQRIEAYEKGKESFGYGLASSYFLTSDLQIKASYEHALRLPNPSEIFGDGLFVQANPDLGPEQSDNLNAGAAGYLKLNDYNRLTVEGSFIYRHSTDLITTIVKPGNPNTSYANLDKTQNVGVEGSFQYEWNNILRAGAAITYQNHVDKADSVYNESYTNTGWQRNYHKNFRIPNKPYLFGNANVGVTLKDVVTEFSVLNINYYLNFVQKYYLTWVKFGYAGYNEDYIIPRQISHDVEFSYSLQRGKYNISLDCKNILDAKLYDKYYLQKPGRAFYLKLRYVL